jgi:uncharacterized protein YjbI with pentapeptide repeats
MVIAVEPNEEGEKGAQSRGQSDSHRVFAPNMISLNANATSSTFATLTAPHSVVTGSNWFNSVLHNTNLESCTFQNCELDGTLFESCSLRGVELRNCDTEGLIINGVRIGALMKLVQVTDGGSHGK